MADAAPGKAREYALRAIREGRVCVVHARSVPARDAVPHEVLGRVVGHNGVYSVGYRSGTWSCSCGTEQPCGHRTAVAQVVGHIVATPEPERETLHGRTIMQDLEMFIDNSTGPGQLHEAGLAIAEEYAAGRITTADADTLRIRWEARQVLVKGPAAVEQVAAAPVEMAAAS
jgi:hypothetical protein